MTTLLTLLQDIGNELGRASGTCSAAGTTTTIVDTSADSPFDVDDTDSLYNSAWAYIEADSAGVPLNVGECRRVAATGYAPSNQTLTTNAAFTNATTTTQSYGIYRAVPPIRSNARKGLLDYINDALSLQRYRYYHLLTLVTDGDMETSGTTNWTANATATRAKGSTYGVINGDYSLTVTCPAAGDYVYSDSINVSSGQTYYLSADVIAPNAYGAEINVYDVTNSAVLFTWNTSQRNQRYFAESFAVPTDCYQIRIHLGAVTENALAVSYWDNICLRGYFDQAWDLPTWYTTEAVVEDIVCFANGNAEPLDDSYDLFSRKEADLGNFSLTDEPNAAMPFMLMTGRYAVLAPVFAVCLRPAAQLSAITESTDVNADLLKADVLYNIYVDMNDKANIARWRERLREARLYYAAKPRSRLRIGY